MSRFSLPLVWASVSALLLPGDPAWAQHQRVTLPSAISPHGPVPIPQGSISMPEMIPLMSESALAAFQLQTQTPAVLKTAAAIPNLATTVVARSAGGAGKLTGDLYFAHKMTDGRLAIVVGDGQGHDVAAARDASMLLAHLADPIIAATTFSPGATASETLERLSADTRAYYDSDTRNMSAALLLVDPRSGKVEYANAGMPVELLLRKANGRVRRIQQSGGFLGDSIIGFDARRDGQRRLRLDPGDMLILPTDGAADAVKGNPFVTGLSDFARSIKALRRAGHDAFVRALARLLGDTGVDDATVLLLQRLPNTPPK